MAIRILAVRTSEPGALLTPSAAELPALVADPEAMLWVDIDAPGPETQKILADVFGLHPLLIEDAFADAPTPKVEDFEDYLYVILHGLTDRDPSDGEIDTADLDFFLGKSWLVTYYRFPFEALEQTRRAVEADPALLARGPAVVAHRVMDKMIDEFLPLMEKLDAEIDAIEAAIVRRPDAALLERIFRMKHSLQRIRRIGLHQRQLLARLARGDFALVPEEVQPFFSDVYDHFVKVTDLNDVYRELMGSSMDAYLGIQSHRLNEVMRMLTIFSTVMLPLNFIADVYGMNFDYMPGLHWKYGYETALAVMTAIGVLMILFFKSRRWV
ncbi:MAG: magnesium/cobalt transporter CorA [Sandaracinaceae bacterium]|nr:magnesium/cobalt transporter CorA [Sandaracinaceae bacterium]